MTPDQIAEAHRLAREWNEAGEAAHLREPVTPALNRPPASRRIGV